MIPNYPRLLLTLVLSATLPATGLGQEETVELTIRSPRMMAGMEAALFVDGEGLKLRLPADGDFTLTRQRPRTGPLILLLELRQRSAAGMGREWSARLTLKGSGRVVWTLEPTGFGRLVEWPLLVARSEGEVLEVLVGGRMAGRTPVSLGIEPDRPSEVLWRQRDGRTACITDVTVAADSARTLSCDAESGTVRVLPRTP